MRWLLFLTFSLQAFASDLDNLPSYIKPEKMSLISENPPVYEPSDAVMGIYYNVLYPQEHQMDGRNLLMAWLRDEIKEIPSDKEDFFQVPGSGLMSTAEYVFSAKYAASIENSLKKGMSRPDAFDAALVELKTNVIPIYIRKAEELKNKSLTETNLSLIERYEIIAKGLARFIEDPEKMISYTKQLLDSQPDETSLYTHLTSTIQKGGKLYLPESNLWNHRLTSLKQSIDKVIHLAPNSPYFLALQEVTPRSLIDLMEAYPELNWISINSLTAKETRVTGEEEVLGEFQSLTNTLALSPQLEVVRMEHAELPTASNIKRRILGVEVLHPVENKKFVIITTHTDHLAKDNLYERNVEAISRFVKEFANGLPFILGGDMNTFQGLGGGDFVSKLRSEDSFLGNVDYREGAFYAHPSIAYATFIGHVLDSYKESLKEINGVLTVNPNALDQIFLSQLKPLYGLREAGVFDESEQLIDPYANPEGYIRRLTERATASDHFLNAVLFKL